MKILITGGSGFIGTNLVDYYVKRGFEVINIDIKKPQNVKHIEVWRNINIMNFLDLKKVIIDFNPDVVFHLAARTDLDGKSINDYNVNIIGVTNLIDALNDCKNLKRVIFASSRLVCKIGYNPINDDDYSPDTNYGISKQIGEEIVRKRKLSFTSIIVRPTSIWGPWFDIPYKNFFLLILKGLYFHPRKIQIFKSFGFIGNVVYQLDKFLYVDKALIDKKVFYVGDYIPIEINEMASLIKEYYNNSKIYYLPIKVLNLMALLGDFLKYLGWKNPPLTTFRLKNLISPMIIDLNSTKTIVGDLPFSLNYGIKETVEWLRTERYI